MRLTVDLSSESLSKAAEQLREYAKTLDAKTDALCGSLAAEAASSAASACPSSEVASTIGCRYTEDGAEVYANGPMKSPEDGSYSVSLAQLIEYGTGIGDGAEYAAEHGFERDMNGHGIEGWVYHKNGAFYRTNGQRAHKYMGNAAEQARANLYSKAKEAFGS